MKKSPELRDVKESKQPLSTILDARALTLDVLFQETWDSYLAAKADGTTAQRVSALKAVHDQLMERQPAISSTDVSDRFADMNDATLIAEIERLLEHAGISVPIPDGGKKGAYDKA